jgi:hypothetical protein
MVDAGLRLRTFFKLPVLPSATQLQRPPKRLVCVVRVWGREDVGSVRERRLKLARATQVLPR